MFKHILILILVVALVTAKRGKGVKDKAKKVDKDAARDRADSVDKSAVKNKAKGKKGKFKDQMGGKNLSKKKLLEHGIVLPEGEIFHFIIKLSS